jgi:predicted MPP superfamily phosphohydrolase
MRKPCLPRLTRRRFLAAAAGSLATAGLAVAGYTWRIEPHWVEVVRRRLPVAGLPESLAGRTLIQISDLHAGPIVDEGYLCRVLEQVSSLHADILALTGDFMTYHGPEQIEQAARVLQHLQPGRLATVAVLGNHDYGARWSQADVADTLTARLRDLGIDVLRNACRDVQGLLVVGSDDLWGPHFQPEKALATLKSPGARVVLCHNPDAADRPVWSGYRGWILSGHTHGGQCRPPFLDPLLLPVANKRYTAGEFDVGEGRRLYINRGLGYLRRVRFNVRPEITVFTLEREDETAA